MSMFVGLLVKMLSILVLCRVLLIAGVQTLTIDSQLGTSIEDCFERISIGEHLPLDAIYRNVSELTTRECEHICKQDKQCQAYDYGVGAKGNATCNLSTLDEKAIKEQNPLKRHPDYDVYIRRFQCEQSPPTPIQTPLSDDPGPQHRPVFRPVEERPTGEDYLISGDIGYGKPDEYRPDDIGNNKPIINVGPSYGDHKPQDIPFRPERPDPYRPNDPYEPERPNDPYRPGRPNDKYRPERPPYGSDIRPQDPPPYGPERPQDQYGSNRPEGPPYGPNKPQENGPNRPQRPDSSDVLQFQDTKPPLSDGYNRPDPYRPENPEYHYIVRPNRRPRPQNVYPQSGYGQSGPIGPPDRPYTPTRPYDKPTYTYNSQYASNYGQNSQNDNSIYVEINDPPRPYVPIKDRPNQQYNGLGYLGYGTYSSQNSYSQSQNQYGGSITEIEYQKPGYIKPPYNDRPQKPSYGSQRPDSYEKPYGSQSGYGSNQGSYGDNQSGYGSNQAGYGSDQGSYGSNQDSYNTNKGSYSNNKGSYSSESDFGSSQYGSNRPIDNSNYGETGYGQNPRPNDYKRPSTQYQGSYGNQNSYKGSYSSSYNEHNSHQSNYNSHGSFESHKPSYEHQRPHKPQKPYEEPSDTNQGGYGSNQNGYGNNHDGYGSSQNSYNSNKGSQSSYGSSSYGTQGNYGASYDNHGSDGYGQSGNRPGHNYGGGGYGSSQDGYGSNKGDYGGNQGGYSQGSHSSQGGYGFSSSHASQSHGESQFAEQSSYGGYGNRPAYEQKPGYGNSRPDFNNRPDYDYERPGYGQRPIYDQKPQDQPGYGQKPNYDSQTSGYGSTSGYNDPKPGYNDPKPGYNDPKPGYNDPKPGYNDPKPGYNDPKPGYNDPKPGYNDPKPGYNDPQNDDKPDPPYQDIKPVYEYDIDKPNNVPAYIAKPGGEVVTSQPVVVGDYGRPGYREPGVPRKDTSYRGQ